MEVERHICYPYEFSCRLQTCCYTRKNIYCAPDQFITAFDAVTGKVIWRNKIPEIRVRESIGLSNDSSLIYVKTNDGKLYGFSASAKDMKPEFNSDLNLSNDMCAAAIVESKGVVFVPSNAGVVNAVDSQTKKLLWKFKVSEHGKFSNAN
jgi:outer membrane protein assembly factor BamB